MPRFDEYTGEHLIPPYRILDLSDRRAAFCGRLLADYGADVVKVEPPSGDPSRRLGPYPSDFPDPERSLDFFFYNTNKRSITLDLETESGRSLFRRLAADADVIIESFDRHYLYDHGIGFDALRADNPGLIMASVTPFGNTGEWADYRGDDLVVMAASGYMQITGEPDEPPVRQGNEHSHYPAAQYAAVGILAALYHRDFGGGQLGSISTCPPRKPSSPTTPTPTLPCFGVSSARTSPALAPTQPSSSPLAHTPARTVGSPPASSPPASGTPSPNGSTR